jgi:EpsI family protein
MGNPTGGGAGAADTVRSELSALTVEVGSRYWLAVTLLSTALLISPLLPGGEKAPTSKPLALFPPVIGSWQGRDVPLEPRIVESLALDDHLNRLYESNSGEELILYVGYYRSQRSGAAIHSPKNCLPGAGWQPISSGHVYLTMPDGERAPVNLYQVQKGINRQIVLYWYQSHGRIIASEYWAKFYMVWDAIRFNRSDAALVRIIAPDNRDGSTACRAIAFAERTLGPLGNLIP